MHISICTCLSYIGICPIPSAFIYISSITLNYTEYQHTYEHIQTWKCSPKLLCNFKEAVASLFCCEVKLVRSLFIYSLVNVYALQTAELHNPTLIHSLESPNVPCRRGPPMYISCWEILWWYISPLARGTLFDSSFAPDCWQLWMSINFELDYSKSVSFVCEFSIHST